MRTTKLAAPFGARIALETDALLDSKEREAFRRAYAEHGLLVIRGEEIDEARQIELLGLLGRVEPGEDGLPLRMEVTNQHEETTAPEGELIFHSDYAYDPAPIPGISMYGALVEGDVTPTLFASASTVLDRLPDRLVEALRGQRAAHACFLYRLDVPNERSIEPDLLIPRGEAGWGPAHYWMHHPAIFANGFGVETLFLCLQHTDRMLDLPRSASDEILEEVYAAMYAPEEVYAHEWEQGDLVVWDNLTVQHARPEPREGARTLRRYHLSETELTADYLRVGREHGLL
ncbi:MAG: TauD/TfdA dioxygenase family protein [Myxococcota bacterium]